MLSHFGTVYTKEVTNELIDSFFTVLKPYTDEQVKKAGYKCLEELEYMPKPAQLINRIEKDTSKHDVALRKRFTCPVCGYYSTMIIDGKCWFCYTGISKGLERNKWHWDVEERDKDYIIEQNIRCQECGMIGICIKTPIKDGVWKCRECYSGIGKEEIQVRLEALAEFMDEGFPKDSTPESRFEMMKVRAREIMEV